MNKIIINKKNNNLEVVSMLMDSVCEKYDCSVKYNPDNDTLDFTGDDNYKQHVAEETMGFFIKA